MLDFIERYHVDREVCDMLLDTFWKNKDKAVTGMVGSDSKGEGIVKPEVKSSTDLPIHLDAFHMVEPFPKMVMACVSKWVEKYAPVGIGTLGITESFNIQWYKPGEGFPVVHTEADCYDFSSRALVFMLYLNDVPNGGTHFVHQKKTTDAVKGDLIIWPSGMTHYHHGVVSKTHEKFIATGWINWIPNDGQRIN